MKSSFSDFIGWFGDTFLSKFKKSAGDAGSSVEDIGTSAEDTETKVATASTEEEASLEGVGTAAETSAAEVGGIGTTAEADVPEVATASTSMVGSIAAVAIPLAAVMGNIAAYQNQVAHPFSSSDLGTNIKNSIIGGIFPVGSGIGDIQNAWNQVTAGPHASGGTIAPGTYGTAGEHGTELLYGGSSGISVMNAQQTASLGSGGGTHVTQLIVDGAMLAQVVAPHMDAMVRARYGAGSRL